MSESISRSHENDLISRRDAIDALKDMYHAAEKWGAEASDDVIKARAESCMASLVEMKLRIEKLPSAQPEIIHCRDCKWHNGENNQCNAQICASMCGDDFCSKGERREE